MSERAQETLIKQASTSRDPHDPVCKGYVSHLLSERDRIAPRRVCLCFLFLDPVGGETAESERVGPAVSSCWRRGDADGGRGQHETGLSLEAARDRPSGSQRISEQLPHYGVQLELIKSAAVAIGRTRRSCRQTAMPRPAETGAMAVCMDKWPSFPRPVSSIPPVSRRPNPATRPRKIALSGRVIHTPY